MMNVTKTLFELIKKTRIKKYKKEMRHWFIRINDVYLKMEHMRQKDIN